MTKKKRINKLARHLRKTHGLEFGETFKIARALIDGTFFGKAHQWFRMEEEWGVFCSRGCCRGATGRGLYIRRGADGKEIVLNSDEIDALERFGVSE